MEDRQRAEHLVERAFARVLTASGDEADLEARLAAATRKLAGSRAGGRSPAALPQTGVRVSRDLHLRILDAIEDQHYTSRPARSRLIALGVAALVVAAAGLVQLQRTRSDALAASLPTVADTSPSPGAVEVPLDGSFRIQFGRRPIGTPLIQHLPADGKQSAARWDGSTLVVDYAGLHFGSTYQLVLTAQYSSKLRDTGNFEKRWTFRAEGAPRLVATTPAQGGSVVARFGLLTVEFTKRPTIDPVIALTPATTLSAGFWTGTTWKVQYANLQPLTRYAARLTLASADPGGRISSSWSFDTEPGAPPAGVPVVWYSTSSHSDPAYLGVPARLVAVDWTGRMVGTLYGASPGPQSPDGSWLMTQDGSGAIRSDGQVLSGQSLAGAAWSDVSGRPCRVALDGRTGQTRLEMGPIGAPFKVITQLGPGSAGPTPLACSVTADRAVIADEGMGGVTNVRIFSLATGTLIYQRRYPADSMWVVSSSDGRYLGESPSGFLQPAAGLIRRTADNAIVARLGTRRVVAFSRDDSLVLTAPALGTTGPVEVQLLNWRTGAVLWRLPGDPQASGQAIYSLAQPNGSAFIVGLANPSGPGDVDGIFLVHPDGQADRIVVGSVFLAGYPG